MMMMKFVDAEGKQRSDKSYHVTVRASTSLSSPCEIESLKLR